MHPERSRKDSRSTKRVYLFLIHTSHFEDKIQPARQFNRTRSTVEIWISLVLHVWLGQWAHAIK